MEIRLANSSTWYRWRLPLGAAALSLTTAAFVLLQAPPEYAPPPATAAAARSEQVRFGPGALGQVVTTPSQLDSSVPLREITSDENGQLLINKPLFYAINYFMLSGNEGDRAVHAEQLLLELKGRLSVPAYAEAARIVQSYLTYMDAHDALLMRQALSIPAPDAAISLQFVERLATWHEQRARLRQTTFGIQTAQAWFAEEENQIRNTLEELRLKLEIEASAAPEVPEAEADALRARRTHGAALASQQQIDVQEMIAGMTKSFATIESEEQQWKVHYAPYQRALDQLGAGLDAKERNRKMDMLREQMLNVVERERARALGT